VIDDWIYWDESKNQRTATASDSNTSDCSQ
jgi:hypothetical protein